MKPKDLVPSMCVRGVADGVRSSSLRGTNCSLSEANARLIYITSIVATDTVKLKG